MSMSGVSTGRKSPRRCASDLGMLHENQGSWLKGLCLWVLQPEVMSPSWLDKYQYTQSWSVYRKPAADVVKEYYTLGGQQ
jgi:hypothetical protein